MGAISEKNPKEKMQTIYVLFVCGSLHGQLMPPCEQTKQQFATASDCKAMLQNLAENPPLNAGGLRYADGSLVPPGLNQTLICMSETTAPATFPVWRPVN
jgi:hypothetical protein